MKKKLFVLFLGALFNESFAQDYYTGKETIEVDGITFDVKVGPYALSLDNATYEKGKDPNLYYKDGSLVEEEDYPEACEVISGGLAKALMKTFSESEYRQFQQLKGLLFWISYVIDSDGNTIEVGFAVSKIAEMLALPPAKFALLENNVKKYVKWKVLPDGKRLKYMYGMSFINWSQIDLPYGSFNIENKLDTDDKFRQPVDFLDNERVMD